MERIKQALERARQERLGVVAEAAPATAPATATDDIAYTQTRTVRVSPAALKNRRILSAIEPGPFTDAYKLLRTQILQRLRENDWSVLAITSPGEHEGKTLTAINLAICMAMEVSYTVLLVDANLKNPSIHDELGIPNDKGLTDYLLDGTPLSELLVHPEGLDHVVVLPGGRAVANSSELLNSPKMAHLVEELKSRYPRRLVLFDLPPVLTTADAVAFAPYVDSTLLVLEDGKTRKNDVNRAMELLSCTTVLGTVLNKAPPPKSDRKA